MTVEKRKVWAHIAGILTAVIWGTTFISTKVLLEDFEPIAVLIYRFIIAYVALSIIKPKPLAFESLKKEFWYFLAGLLGVTIYFLFENIGLTYTLASNASVIVSTAPLFTALLVFIFLKNEKPKKYFFIGFLFAMSGIALISFQGTSTLELHVIGDLLALGAAIVWAFYSVILKKHVDMSKQMIEVTKRIIFYGILTMLPFGAVYGAKLDLNKLFSGVNLGNFLYLGIGASAICYVTWNYSLEVLGALKASLYIYLVPVVAIITSVVVLGEPFTLTVAVGVVLTLAGLLISEKK